METLDESWSQQRPTLMEAILECETPSGSHCEICDEAGPLIVCGDCRSYGYCLCASCDDDIHRKKPFHNRKSFLNGFLQSIPPEKAVPSGFDKFVSKGLYMDTCINITV